MNQSPKLIDTNGKDGLQESKLYEHDGNFWVATTDGYLVVNYCDDLLTTLRDEDGWEPETYNYVYGLIGHNSSL